MALLTLLIIAVLAICAIFILFKLFKKYPLDPALVAKFDEQKKIVYDLIYSMEQKISSLHPDRSKQLSEIQNDFSKVVGAAEAIIHRNDRNFEPFLKIYIASIRLIKTRAEILFDAYEIMTILNVCNRTLRATAAQMRQSTETLKTINSPRSSLVLVKKLGTDPQKTKGSGDIYEIPTPGYDRRSSTPRKSGHLGIVPPPDKQNPKDPDESDKK